MEYLMPLSITWPPKRLSYYWNTPLKLNLCLTAHMINWGSTNICSVPLFIIYSHIVGLRARAVFINKCSGSLAASFLYIYGATRSYGESRLHPNSHPLSHMRLLANVAKVKFTLLFGYKIGLCQYQYKHFSDLFCFALCGLPTYIKKHR